MINTSASAPAVDTPEDDPFARDPLAVHRLLHGRSAVGIHRPEAGRVRVALPNDQNARLWLRRVCGTRTRPDWDPIDEVWTVARPHFRRVTEAVAREHGDTDVWMDITVRHQCDQRCQDATGDECSCVCCGENHGGARYQRGWTQVGNDGNTLIRNERVRKHFVAPGPARPPLVVERSGPCHYPALRPDPQCPACPSCVARPNLRIRPRPRAGIPSPR